MPDIKSEEGRGDTPDIKGEEIKSEEDKNDMPDIKSEEGKDDPPTLPAMPAMPAPPNMSTPYLFLGQEIDVNDDKDNLNDSQWSDSLSPKQRLRFVLRKLLECNVQQALSTTAQHKTIVRPVLLKHYWVEGKLVPSNLKWERAEHYTGVARYLFTPKDNDETCTKCTTTDNYGPFAECVAGGRGVHKGACFNCYYKGEGKGCSLRIAFDKAEEKARYPGGEVPFSAESIRGCKTRDLERVLRWLREEIRSRKEDYQDSWKDK